MIFDKKNIIKEVKFESNRSYYIIINIDGNYEIESAVKIITDVIPEFAFGFHMGNETNNTELMDRIRDAAKSIYKIEEFKNIYELVSGDEYDGEIKIEDKYLRRGEFGELILHLILRDRFNTIPLLSKIYFKDSYGHAVHGFDCVHITNNTNTLELWLGESKLYTKPKEGIKQLIEDLNEHVKTDFLDSEFVIIGKRLHDSNNEKYNRQIKNREKWIELLQKRDWNNSIKHINFPLICTYSSEIYQNTDIKNEDNFISIHEKEIQDLINFFNENFNHHWKTKLNIILILFPIKDKVELVKRLHKKLYLLQNI